MSNLQKLGSLVEHVDASKELQRRTALPLCQRAAPLLHHEWRELEARWRCDDALFWVQILCGMEHGGQDTAHAWVLDDGCLSRICLDAIEEPAMRQLHLQ